MRTRSATIAIVFTITVGALVWASRARPYRFAYEHVMGTSMDLTVVATSAAAAAVAERAVLAQIEHDSRILSAYDRDSEFSRWLRTRGTPVRVSPELFEVLGLFDAWRERTDGALDASAERVAQVWRAAAARQVLPSSAEISSAVADVRRPHWRLDRAAGTATHLDDTPLMLNSFAKSYILERAARAALATGAIRAAVIDVGGDIVARGAWAGTAAVMDPVDHADNGAPIARLALADRAIATSGGYRRGFDIGARHYSHIVDPRTGQPSEGVLSATVVAASGVDAGALATAFCVMTPADGKRLAAGIPGVEFLLVLAGGGRVESAGWRHLEVAAAPRFAVPSPIAHLSASEQRWDTSYELTVTVELAQLYGRARRPYVAIWIEDKARMPIRTIALLFDKYRYLTELQAWSRADRQRVLAGGPEITDLVASATRSPGRYTFKWDGKDQQGQLVKPGPYTVAIEAAREHGSYQFMRQELDFSGVPRRVDLTSNTEISAATVDYHRVGGDR